MSCSNSVWAWIYRWPSAQQTQRWKTKLETELKSQTYLINELRNTEYSPNVKFTIIFFLIKDYMWLLCLASRIPKERGERDTLTYTHTHREMEWSNYGYGGKQGIAPLTQLALLSNRSWWRYGELVTALNNGGLIWKDNSLPS